MNSTSGDQAQPDPDRLVAELAAIDDVSERVRLAGLALAAPLAGLRQAQLEREAARAAARHGADDPEVVSRTAAAQTAARRFDQLRSELARARATPAVPDKGAAAISGIVTRGGQPAPDATVSVLVADGRAGFVCTNAAGTFAVPAPADAPIRLSVSVRDGGEVFRDPSSITLAPGQTIFRHIELDDADAPCAEPAGSAPAADATFPMLQLRGQFEADARRLVAAQGLVLGDRGEQEDPDQVGRVIGQTPDAGAKVKPGDRVTIVVATDGLVEVPTVLGLTHDDARLVLARSDLEEGTITRQRAAPELVGRITAQSPVAGSRAPRRSAVNLGIGIARPGSRPAKLSDDVARVADLAASWLSARAPSDDLASLPLEERLRAAGVERTVDLDELLAGDRHEARDRLGLRTLADTDRLLSALRRARKELGA